MDRELKLTCSKEPYVMAEYNKKDDIHFMGNVYEVNFYFITLTFIYIIRPCSPRFKVCDNFKLIAFLANRYSPLMSLFNMYLLSNGWYLMRYQLIKHWFMFVMAILSF